MANIRFLPALSPTPFNRLATAGQANCFDPYVVNKSVAYCFRIIGITRKSYLNEEREMNRKMQNLVTFEPKLMPVHL